jgi:hypothetical protein
MPIVVALLRVIGLNKYKQSDQKRNKLAIKSICDLKDSDYGINPWQLLAFRNNVQLNLVSYLASECQKDDVGEESAEENTIFNFKPD